MQKYFLYITGCDMNYSDAERIASVFNEYGFNLVRSEAEADVIIAFACSVREKAVHKVLGLGHKWQKMRPKPETILTGCILEQDEEKFKEKFDLVFGIKEIGKLQEWLNFQMIKLSKLQEVKNKNSNLAIYQFGNSNLIKKTNYLSVSPSYKSKFSANLPIMTGCDNFCTYCAVPYTRGREVSRSEEDILNEVRGLVERGYKEITLLGQNVNSYGINNKSQITNYKQISNSKLQKEKTKKLKATSYKLLQNGSRFVQLLQKIDLIEGDYWVRFYSNHPKDMSDELINFLAQSKHFCHYIHLPLQSGDDGIIKEMNRHYTAKQYLELVGKIKKKIPDCVLTTDIIVGFPGETEKAFQNTVKVLEKVGFDMIFISEYSPRSGTPAAKMEDDVPHEEKERRKKFLNDEVLAKSVLKNNKKLAGEVVRVLVYKKDKKGLFIGKTEGLKDVRIAIDATPTSEVGDCPYLGGRGLVGNFANVKITKANSWGLEGELSSK